MISLNYFPDEQNSFFKDKIIGKTIVEIRGAYSGSDHISFKFSDNTYMKMYHSQSCCENVEVDDIVGDIDDLINAEILGAELVRSSDDGNPKDQYDSSYTWSFYKFRTHKGYVDLRWYGSSNGYYSETVDIEYVDLNDFDDWEDVFESY